MMRYNGVNEGSKEIEKMTLGQRIQQIRLEYGLSQEEFGEKLGTTRQTVSRWELDQTYPEIAKIVLMSRVFSVTTDSIVKDGISTFDAEVDHYTCGVYRSPNMEIVETERFALVYYCSADKMVLGTKLYVGYENKKKLVAICERDQVEEKTEYAYLVKDSDPHVAIINSERLQRQLTTAYDPALKKSNTVTMTFNGASNAIVVKNGVKTVEKLKKGVLNLNLKEGEGAFVIPF